MAEIPFLKIPVVEKYVERSSMRRVNKNLTSL
jgi:hypothetical protein